MRKNEDVAVKFGAYFGNDWGSWIGPPGRADLYGYPMLSWLYADPAPHRIFVIGQGQDEQFLVHGDRILIERVVDQGGYGGDGSVNTFFACPTNWGAGSYIPGLSASTKKEWKVWKADRSDNDNIHWGDPIMLYSAHFSGVTLIPTQDLWGRYIWCQTEFGTEPTVRFEEIS